MKTLLTGFISKHFHTTVQLVKIFQFQLKVLILKLEADIFSLLYIKIHEKKICESPVFTARKSSRADFTWLELAQLQHLCLMKTLKGT